MANSVRTKIKGFDKLRQKVKLATELAFDEDTLNACGETIARLNQKAIRQGVNPASKQRFAANSPEWIKRRARLAEFNETAPGYGPRKSNVTFTGQLVNSLTHYSNQVSKTVYVFFANTKRKPYIGVKGKPLKGGAKTNNQLAEYLVSKHGKFVGLTFEMRLRCNEIIRRRFRNLLRSIK